jgi:hypothetical protein
MIALGVLLAVLQAPPDPLLERDRERIRTKLPLTAAERGEYSCPAAPAPKPRARYRLAVFPLSFSDRAIGAGNLREFFFDRLAAYYSTASGGQFKLDGQVQAPLVLAVERGKFAERDLEAAFLAWKAREGGKALEGVDGVAFVAAGPLGARGTPLWPHRDVLPAGDRTVDYILVAEEAGERSLGIAAHEFMHLLGFRDKYDDEKASVGGWCILGTGYNSKDPAPPCADCREKLGWTAPALVDPSSESRVVLEGGMGRSIKIPVNPDGTEYLLLELRDRLFIWHLGGGMTIELVGRWPTGTSDRLTPLSEPPFRGRTVGARDLWITDVRVEGGKAWFLVAPEAALTPIEERRRSQVGKRLGD